MWVEAIITSKDCEDFVRSMTPLELVLDPPLGNRSLYLEEPTGVALVTGKGLLIDAPGRLHWNVAGVDVPITIRTAKVLLVPSIETLDGRDGLVVTPVLERVDFAALPDFIDKSITTRVADALKKSAVRLVWAFTRTLDFHFAVSSAVKPTRQIDLGAKWGRVRVTDEAIVLALSFHAEGVLMLRSKPQPISARHALPTLPDPVEPATQKHLRAVPLRKSS